MKFAIIEPGKTKVSVVEADEIWQLYPQAGLPSDGGVDHGGVTSNIAIVVGEFSLFAPVTEQHYFAIGKQLFAGNAVLYGFDDAGVTIDLPYVPEIFFITPAGIEEAIKRGQILRPEMKINNEVIWRWPEPRPR